MAITRGDITAGYKQGLNLLLDLIGVQAVWTQAKAPNQTANIKVGVRTLGRDEEAMVNAYGVGAKAFVVKATDLPIEPIKFDAITIDGEVYVVDGVFPLTLDDSTEAFRLIARGDEQ